MPPTSDQAPDAIEPAPADARQQLPLIPEQPNSGRFDRPAPDGPPTEAAPHPGPRVADGQEPLFGAAFVESPDLSGEAARQPVDRLGFTDRGGRFDPPESDPRGFGARFGEQHGASARDQHVIRALPVDDGTDSGPGRGGVDHRPRDDRRLLTGADSGGNRLNPKYMFETFVIGSSNRFAHAASVAVAESPAKAYNPLFIYGSSGLGKTHLLHAIGHYATTLGNARSVRYVSTEEFTNDFINSLRDDKTSAFQRRYRDVDILLIDDIQFLENRERTQEEFFHTFNTLHNANKQIVITSDRSPKQLATLEDRLRTRFEWGLLADIQPPDLETRIAILQKKAAQERLYAPPDVLEFIASRVSNSIRELEGALIRVTAFASLTRSNVELSLAEEVLRDFIPDGAGPEITADQIMAATVRLLRGQPGGPARALPIPGAGQRPSGGHVPVPRTDRPVPAPDRPGVRWSRPHHGHARRPQDPPADGRATLALQPDRRADQPDQAEHLTDGVRCRTAS